MLSTTLSPLQIQQQTLTSQQQFALRLLRMSSLELLGELSLALEENPCLEEDDPNESNEPDDSGGMTGEHLLNEEKDAGASEEDFGAGGSLSDMYAEWPKPASPDDETPVVERVASCRSLRKELLLELSTLSIDAPVHDACACLIEELDDRGFLPLSLEQAAECYAAAMPAPMEVWQEALKVLQSFDPPGVGAASAVDALVIQTNRALAEDRVASGIGRLVKTLLTKHLSALAKRDRSKLLKAAGGDEEALDAAIDFLMTLNPHPASNYIDEKTLYVIPDILVRKEKGRWQAFLNPAVQPRIRLSEFARQAAGEKSVFGQYLAEAKHLLSAVNARQATLLKAARLAVKVQSDFLAYGAGKLKPFTIGEAARRLELAESTVSRAVSGKFIQAPFGVMELRALFTQTAVRSLSDGSEPQGTSSAAIRARIRALIAEEPPSKPYSDQKLAEILQNEGFGITRRTVAKYRGLEKIPTARLRAAPSS